MLSSNKETSLGILKTLLDADFDEHACHLKVNRACSKF